MQLINLYSDTQTRPTDAMRRAMATAEVGDEQRGEDPTVNRLCDLVADRLGKASAVFLPSGTMCNEIAILVHCRPGDEIVADRTAHVLNFEGGGPAAFAGALIRTVEGRFGVFTAEQLQAAIRPADRYSPDSRLLVVEQTSNMGGGTLWTLEGLQRVAAVARRHGMASHMDGARLFNAEVALGVPAAELASDFDTVWIDLSKGLGCPIGGVLAGSEEFIASAWRWKQRMGGAMRQAGIVAAAGIHALEHHVERLAEDHANAQALADRIAGLPGIDVDQQRVQTNMVFFDVTGTGRSAAEIVGRLEANGVLVGATSATEIRAVTHLDVNTDQVERAAETLRAVLEGS